MLIIFKFFVEIAQIDRFIFFNPLTLAVSGLNHYAINKIAYRWKIYIEYAELSHECANKLYWQI